MFILIAVAATLMQALDPVNRRVIAKPGCFTQWRQVGLGDRTGNAQIYIMAHGVDKNRFTDYSMYHDVESYNSLASITVNSINSGRSLTQENLKK